MEFPDSAKRHIEEAKSSNETELVEAEALMEVVTKVELELAYSSEKLVNLNCLLMQLWGRENELEAMAIGNDDIITEEFVEKALVFNLLSSVLDSEVREMDNFMVNLQSGIVDAFRKISSCRHLNEAYTVMEEKLRDFDESLKETQYRIFEVKTQSSKLQRTVLAFAHGKGGVEELSQQSPSTSRNGQSNMQMSGHRHILKMLEKSVARELDLEKKLAESMKNEDELKLKLHYTEQVAFRMEETAQVVWGRFLEAENSTVVLKGISHEMLSRFQQLHFNLNSVIQRENELKSKHECCLEEIKLKDAVLDTLKRSTTVSSSTETELSGLKERVKFLEEKLHEAEYQLRDAKTSLDLGQIRITELENLVESMRESIDIADTRAESAELKVAELTGTNVELTEELNFFKGSSSNTEKKLGVLENQLREAEIRLQHTKASSEASQEQQNMLYTAIWDMETLIEELKSKVAKAENKNETTEENCIILSENNAELTREMNELRDRIEELEACLDQANSAKIESAKEVNLRTKLIMEMVTQLAVERERIQKQFDALSKENKNFAAKLGFAVTDLDEEKDDKDYASFKNNSCAKSSLDSVSDSIGKSTFQLDESSQVDTRSNTDVRDSAKCVSNGNGESSKIEDSPVKSATCVSRNYVFVVIFVSLVSFSALYLIDQKQFHVS